MQRHLFLFLFHFETVKWTIMCSKLCPEDFLKYAKCYLARHPFNSKFPAYYAALGTVKIIRLNASKPWYDVVLILAE